ncbi:MULTISPECIES: type IV secretion system DNA-binding domain-containing protein [spotted fever group]|uniref:DNA transport protein TraD n=3 Tax=cellular organisms TaxID=131567 RepID=A0A8E1BZB6_9RICK|nr:MULTISPECIES: type IV secretion system DNA-binding domain-containing protein [spotted fever group]EER20885.1 conjugative transfer protein [Rickettsia endosymbiont of Ixodes scapularis]KDO02241.1 DNA transport protein TraD [Rickettsia tamurae subsp. buchneri]
MNIQEQGRFTRGAQIFAHQIRMLTQGITNALTVGLTASCMWLIFRIFQKVNILSLYYYFIECYVQLKLAVGTYFYDISQIGITFYDVKRQEWIYRSAEEFVYKFWHVTKYGSNITSFGSWLAGSAAFEVLCVFGLTMSGITIFFWYRGIKTIGSQKLRGMDYVQASELTKILKKDQAASSIKFAGLSIVKNSERQHILITGTTGTGKTNMLNELLPQIRSNNEKAIIVDMTGSYVDRFYDPSNGDIILNPFDSRTSNWLPWNDIVDTEDFDDLASHFSSNNGMGRNSFFDRTAELVLAEALKKYAVSRDLEELLRITTYSSNSEFAKAFENTAVAGMINNSAPETSTGVQATLSKNIAALKHLADMGDFSISKWCNDEDNKSWLFLTALPSQRATLSPLLSAWISVALKALMSRDIGSTIENLWFIMDELPALGKINSLNTALAESRKYGGCFVAGIQNIFQLDKIYGSPAANDLLDLFNSKFIFRVGDQQTAHRSAMMLGEQEIRKTQESLSYGSNTIRDGVNINTIEQKKMQVLPAEIMSLPNLSCFVKLAGHYPISKLNMKWQN